MDAHGVAAAVTFEEFGAAVALEEFAAAITFDELDPFGRVGVTPIGAPFEAE